MAILEIPHPDITDMPKTALTADEPAAEATLAVENGLAFDANDLVLIGGPNTSKSEIRRISSTAPTASAMVLNSSYALQFAQTRGTTIQEIYYDQVNIVYSTDFETNWESGAYATIEDADDDSTWTSITTTAITPDLPNTLYKDENTGRAYKTRFYNSQSAVYSGYSDPQLTEGMDRFAIGFIIDRALEETGQKIDDTDSGQFSTEFLLGQANRCISHVHDLRKRWNWNKEYDYDVSEITAGLNKYDLPFSMDVRTSKRSTYNVRVADGKNLTYIDKRELDRLMKKVHTSTTSAELTTASTTTTLTDTSNLDDSGSFLITTTDTTDTVGYSANDRATNTLTLNTSTGVTVTHASGTTVWQGTELTDPKYWTIYERSLYLWPIPNTDHYLKNLSADFYKKMDKLDSMNDYVLFPFPDMVVDYLCWKIYLKLREESLANRYQAQWEEAIDTLKMKEVVGEKNIFKLNLRPYQSRLVERRYSTSKYADEDVPDNT